MKAPFPYFGGKSTIAAEVWRRLGDTPNFVEPFFGSGAMLLARPHAWWERIETVNDADGFVANYWRATRDAADEVAHWADWPIHECDLHARHAWLVSRRETITARLEGNPDWYDAKVAGWWLWGICSWIGSGWCGGRGPWQVVDGELVNGGSGGVWRQLPHLSSGQGINRKLPHLSSGRGINRKLPHLGNSGRGNCEVWSDHLYETMAQLADRLRRVRICCGDWSRVCGPTPTTNLGMTAVFLDPPYSHDERQDDLYSVDQDVAEAVRSWAVANGNDPLYRIALCGYEGEHEMPNTWTAWRWKAAGGYGSQGKNRGRENAARECVWFSPHCIPAEAPIDLFSLAGIAV